jgi:hypothetical protein
MPDEIKPKKMRKRIRESCPEKRDNYKKYEKANWKWIDIFKQIDLKKSEGSKSYIADIAKQYNIKYSTLQSKYSTWASQNRPEEISHKENRGGHNKCFTEDEERKLRDYLKEVYLDNSLFFDDDGLRIIATKKWGLLYTERTSDFVASNGWVYDFKMKWGLSTLTPSCSRKATKDSLSHLTYYLKECEEIFIKYHPSLIFNMDETFWRIINGCLNVIGITGSENRKLLLDIDFKDGFTAVFLISADGILHKTTIILKGKTIKVYDKTELVDDSTFFRKFTETGWMSMEIMIYILMQINTIAKGKPCVLILDCWSIHKLDVIKELALKLNIRLLYVPIGQTATHQPLDVGVNGVVKGIGKHIAREILMGNPFAVPFIKDSITTLIESINQLKKETIISSFQKACFMKKNVNINNDNNNNDRLVYRNQINIDPISDTELYDF